MSGTNAHVIIEQPASVPPPINEVAPPAVVVVPLSGHSQNALRAQARRLLDHLTATPDAAVADLGWSAAATRAALRHRAAVIAGTRAELAAGFAAIADDVAADSVVNVVTGTARTARPVLVTADPDADLIKVWRECAATEVAVAPPAAVPDLVAQGFTVVIQLGGDPALAEELRRVVDASGKRVALLASPAAGQRDFLHALAQAHVTGVAVNWDHVFGRGVRRVELPTYAFQRSRYWASAQTRAQAPPAVVVTEQPAPVVSAVTAASPDRERLIEQVVDRTARLLDLPSSDIEPDEGFFQMGMNSVLATTLRKELEQELGMDLPGTLLFEQPTVTALVDWLVSAAETPAPVVAAAAPDPGPPRPSEQDVSAGDLFALLDAEIERSRVAREGVRT